MRKALLVLGICILAAPAWAGGGFSLFGSYAQVSEDAEALGAGVRLTVGGERWVGDLTWTWYPTEDGVETIPGFEDRLQVVPTDLGFRYMFNSSGSMAPYIGGGGTFFYTNLNDGDIDKAFGAYGLLGFNLGQGPARFFAEAIYRYGRSDVTYRRGGQEFTGRMDVGGFGLNAGVILSF